MLDLAGHPPRGQKVEKIASDKKACPGSLLYIVVPFAARIVNPIFYVDVVKLETTTLAKEFPCTTIFIAGAVVPEVKSDPKLPTTKLSCLIAKVFPFHPFEVLVIRIVRLSVVGTGQGVVKHKVLIIAEEVKAVPAVLWKTIAPVGDFTTKPTSDEPEPSSFTKILANLLFSTTI